MVLARRMRKGSLREQSHTRIPKGGKTTKTDGSSHHNILHCQNSGIDNSELWWNLRVVISEANLESNVFWLEELSLKKGISQNRLYQFK